MREMEPSGVEEHRCQHGRPEECPRHQGEIPKERLKGIVGKRELRQERHRVEGNEGNGAIRRGGTSMSARSSRGMPPAPGRNPEGTAERHRRKARAPPGTPPR